MQSALQNYVTAVLQCTGTSSTPAIRPAMTTVQRPSMYQEPDRFRDLYASNCMR